LQFATDDNKDKKVNFSTKFGVNWCRKIL